MTYAPQVLDGLHGKLLVLAPESAAFPGQPLILLLHGAFEKHKKLLPWADLWHSAGHDVALVDLPGHGQSDPPVPVTFNAYIDVLRWLLREPFAGRRVVIIGDSFGGLLGVALGNQPPANLAGVVALDPLLATAKQWSILDLMPRILDGQPEDGFRRSFAAGIMGMGKGAPEDRRYYHYIEGVRTPALVLAGAEPLGVRRDVTGPSLLDDADRAFLARHVKFAAIPGVGHQLVLQRPAETFAAAREFVQSLSESVPR